MQKNPVSSFNVQIERLNGNLFKKLKIRKIYKFVIKYGTIY